MHVCVSGVCSVGVCTLHVQAFIVTRVVQEKRQAMSGNKLNLIESSVAIGLLLMFKQINLSFKVKCESCIFLKFCK